MVINGFDRYNERIPHPLVSLTGRRWVCDGIERIRPNSLFEFLSKERGIVPISDPVFDHLSPAMGIHNMYHAVERVQKAIHKKELIGIIGDYDADGITATAQLVRFFRRYGCDPYVILPHRERDGYGVKKSFIETMHTNDVKLILTVDTGVSAVSEIALARSYGIDCIVLDHHECGGILPDALIIHPALDINPVLQATSALCGSGLAFTFIRAYEKNAWQERDIDVALAAIGTVADIVPLLGENRMIVALGLQAMNRGGDHPVFELAKTVIKESEIITSSHIGFRIAPQINASGRLSDPKIALEAILHGGKELALLKKLNQERQDETRSAIKFAEKHIDPNYPLLTLVSDEFHPGIIGLVAGRLTEKHGKPSLVGSLREGVITCSLRSIPEYHIAHALTNCSQYLISHGGHAAAGGCTLKASDWNDFSATIALHAESKLKGIELIPSIAIDAEIDANTLALSDIVSLRKLEPFGEGNREPRFLLRRLRLSAIRQVGKECEHLQCMAEQHKAIGFRMGHLAHNLPTTVDVVCRLGIDSWNGNERVQLFLEDLREHSPEEDGIQSGREFVDQVVQIQ